MIFKKAYDFEQIEVFLKSNFSSPTHWSDWNLIVSKHYNTNFYYFTLNEGDELYGICPVHEFKKGLLSSLHSGQFKYIPNGGWIFNTPGNYNISDFQLTQKQSLSISSLPLLKEFNVTYTPENYTKSTLIIDLKKSQEEIWMEDISSKRRNMIRKAEKSGIKVIKHSGGNFEEFYNLYHTANTKNKIGVHSLNFFNDLMESCKNIAFTIWYALFQDKIIGSIVTVNDKNYSIYWLGIGIPETENIGQGEMLQWEVIKEMKHLGCSYYDLCHIDKVKLPHIYTFKSGFSKTEIPIASFRLKSPLYSVLNKIQRLLK